MYTTASARSRSSTSTCTASRVEAVLARFLGDAAGFIARGLVSSDRAATWFRDLRDVLILEAVERFQIGITLPDGRKSALDYEVSDDGSVAQNDGCGGFATHWIPEGARVTLVILWRTHAKRYEEARKLLQDRGWGRGSMLEASSTTFERAFSQGGYSLKRRVIGEWPA
mgnify:CR=1 FL=1